MEQRRNPWLALVVLCIGSFVILLDATIVNVAIPTMLDSLHASLDQILWVVNAYLLTFAVLLITAGRLGDIFGQRNLFAGGLGLFSVASALCGLAQDPNQLIAARALQGVGAAVLAPQALVIVASIFPAARRGAALGILASITGLASLAGPTLGGALVTYASWRWIFFVNVPIGIAGIALAFFFVPDLRPGRRHGLDLGGVGLATAGLIGVVYGLIEGQRYQWGRIGGSSSTIPEVMAAGILLLALFLLWERYQKEPLLPLSLFRNRNYSIMVWLNALLFFALFGLVFVTTLDMQSVLGMSAVHAGLTTIPMTLGIVVVAPFAGRLTDRIGGRYILMLGFLLFAAGIAGVSLVESTTATSLTFALPLALAGVGMGCVIAPTMTEAMREIQPAMAGAASGLLNTTRQIGSAIGGALIAGAILQNQLTSALHSEAVSASAQLSAPIRTPFVNGFADAAKNGLQVGRGQAGGVQLSAVPPQALQLVQGLIHTVFVNGFTDAMRPTLTVAVGGLLLGSVSCVLIVPRRRTQTLASLKPALGLNAPAADATTSRAAAAGD